MLATGSVAERAAQQDLRALCAAHPLDLYTLTRVVRIEQGAVPHSHPILTLNTRYRGEPDRLLATYLHEQMHWKVKAADGPALVAAVQAAFPELPTEPLLGARDRTSTFLHVAVCYGEVQALRDLLGRDRAERAIEAAAAERYRALYELAIRRAAEVARVLHPWFAPLA